HEPEFGQPHLFTEFTGTLVRLPVMPRHEFRYRQVCAAVPPAERNWAPATRVPVPKAEDQIEGSNDSIRYRHYQTQLKTQCPDVLVSWTRALVRRLAEERRYGLTPADLQPAPGPRDEMAVVTPPWAEKVARALTDYLALSGEYSYTLDLQRE